MKQEEEMKRRKFMLHQPRIEPGSPVQESGALTIGLQQHYRKRRVNLSSMRGKYEARNFDHSSGVGVGEWDGDGGDGGNGGLAQGLAIRARAKE